MPCLTGLQYARCGPIAKKRRGDDVFLAELVEPKGQGTELYGHQKHDAGPRLRKARRDRQPGNAAGATQAEHRHALDVGAKAHAIGDARLEARSGDAGRGDGDDCVDLRSTDAGAIESPGRGVDEQLRGAIEVGAVSLRPPKRLQVPFQWAHRVAADDARVLENPRQALEVLDAICEATMRRRSGVPLFDDVGRHGGCNGKQLDRLSHG